MFTQMLYVGYSRYAKSKYGNALIAKCALMKTNLVGHGFDGQGKWNSYNLIRII